MSQAQRHRQVKVERQAVEVALYVDLGAEAAA